MNTDMATDMGNRISDETEIDLIELFGVLIRHKKILILGVIIGCLVAGGFTYLQTPVYQSEASLYILSKTTSIISVTDLQIGLELSSDFAEITQSKPVLDAAIETVKEERGVTLTRQDIRGMMSVSVKDDTRILQIQVSSTDRELACAVANAVCDASAEQMAEITKSDPPSILERAEVEDEPVDNGLTKKTIIGGLAGFVIMAVICIVPWLLNDRIRTSDDVEKSMGVQVLAVIPAIDSEENKSRGTKLIKKQKR